MNMPNLEVQFFFPSLATVEATSIAWRPRRLLTMTSKPVSQDTKCKPSPRHLQWHRVLQDFDRSRSPDRRLHRKAGWPSLQFVKVCLILTI